MRWNCRPVCSGVSPDPYKFMTFGVSAIVPPLVFATGVLGKSLLVPSAVNDRPALPGPN